MEVMPSYKMKLTDEKGNTYDFSTVVIYHQDVSLQDNQMIVRVEFRGIDADSFFEMKQKQAESKRLLETLKLAGMGRRALDFSE